VGEGGSLFDEISNLVEPTERPAMDGVIPSTPSAVTGPPTVWQGWVVLLGILAENIVAAPALLPRHTVGFLCFVWRHPC
jgi:hypothetical protein